VRTKIEVPSFTHSKDVIEPKSLKMGHVSLTTPIWGIHPKIETLKFRKFNKKQHNFSVILGNAESQNYVLKLGEVENYARHGLAVMNITKT